MLSSNGYKILILLKENNCTNEKTAYTLKQINEKTNISISTIRKMLILLYKIGYINNGFQYWKAYSYFITEKGLNYINNLGEGKIYESSY